MALNSVPQTQSVPQNIIEQCMSAGSTGNIEELYGLIKEHPRLLDEIDSTPFLETPLHKAAAAGHISFAVEIMALKPSLSRKLNGDGLSPLHLALEEISKVSLPLQQEQANPNPPLQGIRTEPNQASQQTQPNPSHALQQTEPDQQAQFILTHALPPNLCTMVFCLLDFDKDIARVKGKECWTPFHYAAKIGDPKLLIGILIICPESILDLTANGETALHIALKYKKHKAYFMLYNWIYLTSSNEVFWRGYKLQNCWAETNEEISKANVEISKAKEEISTIKRCLKEKDYNEIASMLYDDPTLQSLLFKVSQGTRNALLVIVALLITINVQFLLTPPGGIWQDDANSHDAGTAIMGTFYFSVVGGLNAASLMFSLATTIFLLPRSPFSAFCILPIAFVYGLFSISQLVHNPDPEYHSKKYRIIFPLLDVGFVIIIGIFGVFLWFWGETFLVRKACVAYIGFRLWCRRRSLD